MTGGNVLGLNPAEEDLICKLVLSHFILPET